MDQTAGKIFIITANRSQVGSPWKKARARDGNVFPCHPQGERLLGADRGDHGRLGARIEARLVLRQAEETQCSLISARESAGHHMRRPRKQERSCSRRLLVPPRKPINAHMRGRKSGFGEDAGNGSGEGER